MRKCVDFWPDTDNGITDNPGDRAKKQITRSQFI